MAFEARQQFSRGQYGQASELLEAAIADSPEMTPAWEMLVRSRVAMGDIDAARSAVESWHDSGSPTAPTETDVADLVLAMELEGTRGYWVWNASRLEALMAAGHPVPRIDIATSYAALGDADNAFAYLVEAFQNGEPGVLGIRSDPAWDDLRTDKRYREVGRKAQEMMRERRPPRAARTGGN